MDLGGLDDTELLEREELEDEATASPPAEDTAEISFLGFLETTATVLRRSYLPFLSPPPVLPIRISSGSKSSSFLRRSCTTKRGSSRWCWCWRGRTRGRGDKQLLHVVAPPPDGCIFNTAPLRLPRAVLAYCSYLYIEAFYGTGVGFPWLWDRP